MPSSACTPSWKLTTEFVVIGILVLMNLRAVKESVTVLAPIFLLFLVTHAVLILGTVGSRAAAVPEVYAEVKSGFSNGVGTLGVMGLLALFLRAYTSGAGTYTGIEAVSNGLMIMREPKVATGKRTMLLMATSLALTLGALPIQSRSPAWQG
jgi:amino acid transporter